MHSQQTTSELDRDRECRGESEGERECERAQRCARAAGDTAAVLPFAVEKLKRNKGRRAQTDTERERERERNNRQWAKERERKSGMSGRRCAGHRAKANGAMTLMGLGSK